MKTFNKLSIRVRLVSITVLILTLCCAVLTLIINYSATKMVGQVAQTTVPALSIDTLEKKSESPSFAIDIDETLTLIERQQQIIDDFYTNSYLYMLCIIIAGGIMMYLFSKRILLPLAKLNEKMKNSSIANLSDKIAVPNSNDEIAEIAISFNKMTQEYKRLFGSNSNFLQM